MVIALWYSSMASNELSVYFYFIATDMADPEKSYAGLLVLWAPDGQLQKASSGWPASKGQLQKTWWLLRSIAVLSPVLTALFVAVGRGRHGQMTESGIMNSGSQPTVFGIKAGGSLLNGLHRPKTPLGGDHTSNLESLCLLEFPLLIWSLPQKHCAQVELISIESCSLCDWKDISI